MKNAASDTARLRLCNVLSAQFSASDNATAIYFAQEAIAIAKKRNDNKAMAEALINMAYGFYYSGKNDSAIQFYNEAIRISRMAKDSTNVIVAYNRLGGILREKGDNAEALKFYNRALACNIGEKNISEAASSYLNIGVILHDQKNLKDALKYEELGLKLYLQTNETAKIANCYARIGNLYGTMRDSAVAVQNYEKAMALFEKAGSKRGVAVCLNNLGTYYSAIHDTKKAFDYLNRALEIREGLGDKNGAAIICNNIGNLFIDMKDYEQAQTYFNKGLKLSLEIGFKDATDDSYFGLASMYEKTGDEKNALAFYKLYHNLYDTLFNEQNSKQINELNAQFDAERKEKKIELLSKDAIISQEERAAENARATTRTWFLVAGLIAAGLISFVILRSAILQKRANVILEKQKNEIDVQKKIVEGQHHDILDSINYAQRIQTAVLPSEQEMRNLFPESFVFFQPRDIVSGDFWWIGKCGEIKIIAVADCTGHGVPGAFMSLIGNTALNEIVKEKHITDPGEILTQLSLGIVKALKQEKHSNASTDTKHFLKGVKDGMDIAICCIDEQNGLLKFSGANNPLYYIENGNVLEIKGNRQPVGVFQGDLKPFTVHTLNLKNLEAFYLFSDGFADQFGGAEEKKFKYSRLKEVLFSNYKKSPIAQEKELRTTFESWKRDLEQVDDVCVVGVRIS